MKAHKDDWKHAKHVAQWEANLTKDAKALANLPIAAIDTSHVLAVLEPIWRKKPETASHTRARVERVLAYAIAAKYCKREDGNPARWDGHLQELLGGKAKVAKLKRERTGKSGHHPALPYKQATEFMAALRALDSLSVRALELTILTADRMKMKEAAQGSAVQPRRCHPRKAATQERPLIQLIGHGDAHVPARPIPRPDRAWVQIDIHGLGARADRRREGRDRHGAAHAIGDRVEEAYRRGDLFGRRERLMQQWADRLLRQARRDRRDRYADAEAGRA